MRKGHTKISHCAAFFLIAMLAGISGSAYAEELTVTVNSGASVALTPSMEGAFASTEDEGNTSASFSVTTDNYTGYSLRLATGNEGEYADKLTNTVTKDEETTVYAIGSIGAAVDRATFNTNAYDNTWGIKPSKYNSVGNVKFLPVISGMLIDDVKQSGTFDYTLAVGIRANYENPAGIYTNTLVLTAVANPTVYEVPVTFGEGVEGVVFTLVGETEAAVTISAPGETALLTYGAEYEITAVFEDGYEMDTIEITSGTLDAEAGTYKIEVSDEAPAVSVSGKILGGSEEGPEALEAVASSGE